MGDVDVDVPSFGRVSDDSAVPSVLTKLNKWANYAAMGEPVKPTLFIPCKTPLSKNVMDNWSLPDPPLYPLTVPKLLQHQIERGRTIGLILDLSNNECLYSDNIPPEVRYLHIRLVAKELPAQDFINEVCAAAKAFWEENPGLYIAIHCAYGFNRTGFTLCSYLIQVLGMTVDEALAAFKEARPPGVKHEDFVMELRRRYESEEESPPPLASASDRYLDGFGDEAGLRQGLKGTGEGDMEGRCGWNVRAEVAGPSGPGRPAGISAGEGGGGGQEGGSIRCTEGCGGVSPEGASPLSFKKTTVRGSEQSASPAKSCATENESFGFTERAILQGLRDANLLDDACSAQAESVEMLQNILDSRGSNNNIKGKRPSVGNIDWGWAGKEEG